MAQNAKPTRRAAVLTLYTVFSCGILHAAVRSPIRCQPTKLTNGSPVLFWLTAPENMRSVSAVWIGRSLSFSYAPRERAWYALGGVSLETAPGTYELRVSETLPNGRTSFVSKHLKITRASYPKITIRVAKQYTEPSSAQLAAIAVNKELKEKIFAAVGPEKLWSGPFIPPVSAPVSDLFGTARVFNQEVQSRHQGLDYAAPAGTPVRAVNNGTVILARPMFFEGNFIVIDHGQGLLSLYLHLSEFKVKEGESVHAGQEIALSGGTGRATGAHLHLAIRWKGVYLDPAILLKLPLPRD